MRIWLNEQPLHLATGMKIRDALIQADLLHEIEKGSKVFDEWGNEVGLDGALQDECRYIFKTKDN
jgi:hypothetical protein